MKTVFLFGLLMLCSWSSGSSQDQPKRAPSTPEERQRFLALAHKLEESPLDKSLYPDKKWGIQWIDDIPDINVSVCPAILGTDFLASHYKYAADLQWQVVFGNVAYLIEHPDKANDHVAQFEAGVESALKAYKNILKADPVISRPMEELLRDQTKGKLVDTVRENSKPCQEGDRIGM